MYILYIYIYIYICICMYNAEGNNITHLILNSAQYL